ncbi:hypothetical protein HK097_005419 [Rhizophlyctis rosea]|uniref:FAD-binding FR-type domain-containing protein n=1 Tax=Rhizophlyctis rosea TaxID=64517 RepID=A0AAD5SGR4_9FUNG|nr:hypothetical protein HK097_005419 [Rhizophlyctis rosea]
MSAKVTTPPLIPSNNALIAVIAAVFSVPVGLFLGLYMMEVPCYADYCVEHSYPTFKRGSQIALGVFYFWLVFVVGVMFKARRNPTLHRYLHQPLYTSTRRYATFSMSRGEALFHFSIAVLILFNLIFFLIIGKATVDGPDYDSLRSYPGRILSYYTTQVTGKLLDVALGIIMLLSAKNSGFQILLGVSYESGLRAHRYLGWYVWWVTVLHTFVYIFYISMYRTTKEIISLLFAGNQLTRPGVKWGRSSWLITMGTLSTFFLLILAITALPRIRRKNFNIFYYVHFTAFPALFFAFVHAPSDFYYCIPGLVIYFTDVFLRLRNENTRGRVVNVQREPCGYVRVDFAWPTGDGARGRNGGEVAGKWVFVNFRDVSRLEWHPYSLANGPDAEVGTLLFKPRSGAGAEKEFETKLANFLLEKDASLSNETSGALVGLDGPFGEMSFVPEEQDSIICFVAGTGLVPAISLLRQWLTRRQHAAPTDKTPLTLIWSLKESGGEKLSLLKELAAEAGNLLSIHVTQTGDDSPPASSEEVGTEVISEKVVEQHSTEKVAIVETSPAVRVTTGRADILDVLTKTASSLADSKLGIFICGGPQFVASVSKTAADFAKERKGNMHVAIHSEGYQW